MNIDYFKGHNVVYAKDQPDYHPLPVYARLNQDNGHITSCWKLSFLERLKLLITGRLWLCVLTFKQPLQPLKLSVDKPEDIVTK